jgi:hypothetical protein
MYLNDDKQKAKASDAAKQAMKDAAKRKNNLDKYNSTLKTDDKYNVPMKNAAIDYFNNK